jgi:hypothetical protein
VSVHGLGDHGFRIWMPENREHSFWLNDSLPTALPIARIFSFGYNTATISSLSGDGTKTSALLDEAQSLLQSLIEQREGCEPRPIIFICNGVGGLIVKRVNILQ